MTVLDWSLMTAASLMGLAGLACLYASWKQPGRPVLLAGGWALLTAGIVTAFSGNGDRGVAQAVIVVMAAATAVFAVPIFRGLAPPVATGRVRAQARQSAVVARPWLAGLSGLWTFLLTGPVAGGIALLAAAILFEAIRPADGSPATAGAIAIIAAVFLWALVSVLLLIEPRPRRRTLWAGAALAATALLAFI
jgi:hypothetical protein